MTGKSNISRFSRHPFFQIDMSNDKLKLKNQLCFRFYAASRLITKAYQPFLSELELSYPQYLVLLVLWEHKQVAVKTLSNQLLLETNTLTPLLKRMEQNGLVIRTPSETDHRSTIISLTPKAEQLRWKAQSIPEKLLKTIAAGGEQKQQLLNLLQEIDTMLDELHIANPAYNEETNGILKSEPAQTANYE